MYNLRRYCRRHSSSRNTTDVLPASYILCLYDDNTNIVVCLRSVQWVKPLIEDDDECTCVQHNVIYYIVIFACGVCEYNQCGRTYSRVPRIYYKSVVSHLYTRYINTMWMYYNIYIYMYNVHVGIVCGFNGLGFRTMSLPNS